MSYVIHGHRRDETSVMSLLTGYVVLKDEPFPFIKDL